MTYDFTTVLDRQGHDIIATDVIPFPDVTVDKGFPAIPMWIADMSFPTAPCILEALEERLRFPNFGYFLTPDAYYDAVIRWHRERKGVTDLEKEDIGYENGVLGGVSSAIRMLTAPGDKILLHAPTYVGFTHVLENTGRSAVHSDLKRDGQGVWRMDYEDMDRKLKEHKIHLAIFCSPHNPTGRVWERWEIEKAMEVYAANDCLVISDEIWSDILMPGVRHIPTQSVSADAKARTIAFYAPSKTFSLAKPFATNFFMSSYPSGVSMSRMQPSSPVSTRTMESAYLSVIAASPPCPSELRISSMRQAGMYSGCPFFPSNSATAKASDPALSITARITLTLISGQSTGIRRYPSLPDCPAFARPVWTDENMPLS